MPAWVLAGRGDAETTGSIAPRRGTDASAKEGNAAQPNRLVPQYGNTASSPAE